MLGLEWACEKIKLLMQVYHAKRHQKVVKRKTYKKMFSRWDTIRPHTWQHRLFGLYNEELIVMMRSYDYSKRYTYSNLGKEGAQWTSLAKQFFKGSNDNALTIRKWSDTFDAFENWTMLNCAMALSSYFETYLSSVISLALESDPGVMIGKSHTVDGMELIKYKKQNRQTINKIVENCTKGEWTKRLNAMESVFGKMPDSLRKNIKMLEAIRIMRNRVGHAFGRDIKKSREIDNAVKISIEHLSRKRFENWQKCISTIVSDVDTFLLMNHIGSFQQLLVYHSLYPTLDQTDSPFMRGHRMMAFKKTIGTDKIDTYSKDFCRSLVSYYEAL